MTRARSLILVIALVFGSIGADPAEPVPAEEPASPQTREAGSEEEASESAADSVGSDVGARVDPHPIFVPPQRGAPEMIVGGGTRGSGTGELPGITAIVPGQVGFTLESRPTLYWFLSDAVDRQAEIIVVLAESEEPLLETVIPGPLEAGIQRLSLADHGVSLKRGVTYEWLITLIPDVAQSWVSVVSGGAIKRIEATKELRSELAAEARPGDPFVLARHGIWYDSVEALSRQIEASPGDAGLRLQRAALMEGVGLHEIGRAERSEASRARE